MIVASFEQHHRVSSSTMASNPRSFPSHLIMAASSEVWNHTQNHCSKRMHESKIWFRLSYWDDSIVSSPWFLLFVNPILLRRDRCPHLWNKLSARGIIFSSSCICWREFMQSQWILHNQRTNPLHRTKMWHRFMSQSVGVYLSIRTSHGECVCVHCQRCVSTLSNHYIAFMPSIDAWMTRTFTLTKCLWIRNIQCSDLFHLHILVHTIYILGNEKHVVN